MMPTLTTRSLTSPLATLPEAAAPLRTPQSIRQRHPFWLGTLRQRFRHQPPEPIQVSDASLARRADRLLKHEVAFSAVCQGITYYR
jgi:hypothetical protein